ncbi:MAG: hypothetical protein HY245_06335 [Rhizobiales bacterium]|nr:hypothetical protein [Hyphomicrobiales bacterium]MBI3673023.1 hypothetical protein [Hyphomicrobiales bacterium]
MKFVVIAAFFAAALATPAAAQSIGGHYKVAGTNFDGAPYSGEADIALTSQTTCEIKWTTGSTESSGICMRNDDSFAAGYVIGDKIGLVIYKLMADGTLNGLWTIAGQEGNGTEVLTPG